MHIFIYGSEVDGAVVLTEQLVNGMSNSVKHNLINNKSQNINQILNN